MHRRLNFRRIDKAVFVLTIFCLMGVAPARTAEIAEEQTLLDTAFKAFEDGFYDLAENKFRTFLQHYPISDNNWLAMQMRLQAEAESHLQREEYAQAAEDFARFLERYPSSPRYIDALLGEAFARFHLEEYEKSIELLSPPEGEFQTFAKANPQERTTLEGMLLLSEAYLTVREWDRAGEALQHFEGLTVSPATQWKAAWIRSRILVGKGNWNEAFQTTTNLVVLAAEAKDPRFAGESVELQASILEGQGKWPAAREALKQNLDGSLPPEFQSKAALRIASLWLRENRPQEAAAQLTRFLEKQPSYPKQDLLIFTLGEIHLDRYYGLDAGLQKAEGQDFLSKAQAEFERLLSLHPDSDFKGRARLNLGWIHWERLNGPNGADSLPLAVEAFSKAAQELPPDEDQAIARFKLADSLFRSGRLADAVQHYRGVVEGYQDLESVQEVLVEQALYQILRIGLESNDLQIAQGAMLQLLERFPNNVFSQRGRLVLGHGLNRLDQAPDQMREVARKMFQSFIGAFPESSLIPEARLGLARSYEREGDWESAHKQYESWVRDYPDHRALPFARYYLALSEAMLGNEEGTFQRMTNFVSQYRENTLAPIAQNWIADYYHRRGQLVDAEREYKKVYIEWPESPLRFQAQLMASRCAFLLQRYEQSKDYLTGDTGNELINKIIASGKPHPVLDQAWFALGDLYTEMEAGPEQKKKNIEQAITVFERIQATNTLWRVKALGRIGGCYLELAAEDRAKYEKAEEAFLKVVNHDEAGFRSVSLAQLGLGKVYEKTRRTDESLKQYLSVFYGDSQEARAEANRYYVQQAGLAAVGLLEQQRRLKEAENLYRRLMELFPAQRQTFAKQMETLASKR